MTRVLDPIIVAIDTSADETSAAVTCGHRVFSKIIYSQVVLYKQWGGIVPSIAKRAHQQRIDWVVEQSLRRYARLARLQIKDVDSIMRDHVDYVAVTRGPGLAIALGVGIEKAKSLATTFDKPLIGVNHLEGHLYSPFIQNSEGSPRRPMEFPILGFLVSGGHTMLVLWKDHLSYEILGETLDDAAGEALDKAAKMIGLGYPGGAVIERLAQQAGNTDEYRFPRPMIGSKDLQFSFSGLKTAFLYKLRDMPEDQIPGRMHGLLSSFQEAVFDTLISKLNRAIKQTGVVRVALGGGVSANARLRMLIRRVVKANGGVLYTPSYPYLYGDNAAMIGVAAHHRARAKQFSCIETLDRVARLGL